MTPIPPQTTFEPLPPVLGSASYVPEVWNVEKDVIYAAILAVESGLEYARECLATHDSALGRTTHKNKTWAETIESDIRHMERTLAMLRACRPNDHRELPPPTMPENTTESYGG